MAKRLDLKDLNIYYGSFHAVADVALSVQPRSVTALSRPTQSWRQPVRSRRKCSGSRSKVTIR